LLFLWLLIAAAPAGMAREKKLTVISVSKEPKGLNWPEWGRVNPSEVTNFTRQLATMINAGLPITDALNLLQLQSGPRMSGAVGQIMADVQSGVSLSEAMSKHPALFSKVYVALVRAGEAAGVVETILIRLADTLEKGRAFHGKVISAMIYPIIILVGMAAVILAVFALSPFILLYLLMILLSVDAGLWILSSTVIVLMVVILILTGSWFTAFQISVWSILFEELALNRGHSKLIRLIERALPKHRKGRRTRRT